jgi:multidrug efflux pump subunit AcrB
MTLSELQEMSDEQLIAKCDQPLPDNAFFIIEELARRNTDRATQRIEAATRQMLHCTYAITGMTIVMTIIALISLFR